MAASRKNIANILEIVAFTACTAGICQGKTGDVPLVFVLGVFTATFSAIAGAFRGNDNSSIFTEVLGCMSVIPMIAATAAIVMGESVSSIAISTAIAPLSLCAYSFGKRHDIDCIHRAKGEHGAFWQGEDMQLIHVWVANLCAHERKQL